MLYNSHGIRIGAGNSLISLAPGRGPCQGVPALGVDIEISSCEADGPEANEDVRRSSRTQLGFGG